MALWPALRSLDDDLASALFWLVRRVRDIADLPPEGLSRWSHAAVVRVAAGRIPEIADELHLLAMPRVEAGGKLDAAAIACQRIARWGSGKGLTQLARYYAEAAVALMPTSGRHAYEAGRTLRPLGLLDDAELLYGRALALTRRRRSAWVYVRAHLGLGQIQKARGNVEEAGAHFATAASAASFAGEKWLAGLTEHDLLVLMAENEKIDEALHHARRACDWLPKHHARLPALVHDYCLLLLRYSSFEVALPLLEAVMSKPIPEVDKVIGWSTYARTAASLANEQAFLRAAERVVELAERFDLHAAAAYANLATGAYLLGRVAEAEAFAKQSIAIARERTQAEALSVAEPLLDKILRGIAPPSQRSEVPPAAVLELARRLEERLKLWRGRTWKRKRQSGVERLGTV